MIDAAVGFVVVSFVALGYLYAKVRRLEDRLTELYIPPACAHEDVVNEGTFGAPEYRCQRCKQLV